MTITQAIVLFAVVIVLVMMMIAHWPNSLWELREVEEEPVEYPEGVYFKPDAYNVEGGAWYFKGYDGTEWGPFKSERVAQVNHRHYVSAVDDET